MPGSSSPGSRCAAATSSAPTASMRWCGAITRRRVIAPHHRIEAVGADEVAAAHRDPGEDEPGIDGVVEPGHLADRLTHQIAGVEGQNDLMVALGVELLAQELAMARRT